MTWNYRVVRETIARPEDEAYVYRIHEVYYDEAGTIKGSTVDPVVPMGDALEELKTDLEWMTEALTKPVLEEVEIAGKTILQEVRDQ